MIKTCNICGKEFQGRPNRIYCSAECRLEAKNRYMKEYRTLNHDKILQKQQEWYHKNLGRKLKITSSDNIALSFAPEPKPKPKPKPKLKYRPEIFNGSQWGRKYYEADRLTQISMLSAALSKYEIEHLSYGQLSLIEGTEKYYSYLKQVLTIKEKEEAI